MSAIGATNVTVLCPPSVCQAHIEPYEFPIDMPYARGYIFPTHFTTLFPCYTLSDLFNTYTHLRL